MEVLRWIGEHWLDLVQSAGIIVGLFFTAYTIREDGKGRRVANLISLSQQHRDIWKQLFEQPYLARVLEKDADLASSPITTEERLFAKLLILHLDSVHRATKEDMFVNLQGLQTDIRMSFARPILWAVWNEIKEYQNDDFVAFVESSCQ